MLKSRGTRPPKSPVGILSKQISLDLLIEMKFQVFLVANYVFNQYHTR